jgi:hypothetical protein
LLRAFTGLAQVQGSGLCCGVAGSERGLVQLTCISVSRADFRQGVFTQAIGIALAGFRQLDNPLRDCLVNTIPAIPDAESQASQFECDAHDPRRVGVEPLTVQILPDWHGALLVTGGSASGLSATDAPVPQSVMCSI